ncbi:MAG: hypothetical protein V7631_3713 [Massilia sp.]|jgi:CheY-like chemotaxis protein
MVVDDSHDVRELAENHLRAQGYRVLAAQSGEEAMELIERYGDIDLLCSDIIMPGGMNGLRLAELVRERQPEVAVLLATGYMNELPASARAGSPFAVLSKPYRLSELSERIRLALKVDARQGAASDFQHEG